MPQSAVITLDEIPVHDTHCMGYEPCLFLECSKCGLTAKADPKELAKPCVEDLVKP